MSESVKEYLSDFQKKELPELVERDLNLEETKKIKSVLGPRRAGKTYFMYQNIKELIKKGVKKESILYLNFEDPRLSDTDFKEIRDILKLHWQLYPVSTKENMHLFIDESQNIKNWESAVRALHDEGFSIFLSGSSSKLLSQEIATSLRGRTLSYTLLPFSFKEFLRIKNAPLDLDRLSSKEKSVLLNLLDEYMEFGGFPEVILEKNQETKLKILMEYMNSVAYKDIVERYKIKNIQLIKWLVKSLTTAFSSELSVHKTYLTLKSRGLKVSKNTLYAYLSMLEDSLFAFFIPKFDYSERKRGFSIHKSYLCDVGFTRLTETTKDYGHKMENLVFLQLERRKHALTRIFYWKNQQQEAVDFVIKEGSVTQLIQVCYDLSDPAVKKRELRALLKASKELGCDHLLVITQDYEAEEDHDSKKILFTPLWKWLLQ